MTDPASRRAACAAFTLHMEDQTDSGVFENDPNDPGGMTRWGVTAATYAAWLGRPVTEADMRSLPRSTAVDIYVKNYWNPCHGDDLPAGVDLMVVDMAYNAGNGRAERILQGCVGAVQDGAIGPATLAAVHAADTVRLIDALTAAEDAYYRSLPGFVTYGRGWTARVDQRRKAALRMVG